MPSTSGFVNLHCHLLAEVDDGAKSLEESLAMARALVAAGFCDVAPSPHAWPELPGPAELAPRRAALQASLTEADIPLTLHPNAENRFDDFFFERLAKDEPRPIGAGRYVLIEAPFDAPLPSILDLLFRIQLKGLRPVIAHPERCMEFQRNPDRAAEVVERGALLQLELGAPLGRYGPAARKLSAAFLSDGLYAIAASDLHGPTGAERWLPEAIEHLAKRGLCESMLKVNPSRILRGEPLEGRV